MEKKTNRKAFNFYKSYLDVYEALDKDKDKLAFINALLNKQFYGEEPDGIEGMAKFAYTSQKEVIDKQIKGWEDKTKQKLSTPWQGGLSTPSQQEKEQGEEKEKEQEREECPSDSENPFDIPIDEFPFEDFWNIYDKKTGRHKCELKWNRLTKSTKEKIMTILPDYISYKPDKQYRPNPLTFLNGKMWEDEIVTDTVKEEESEQQIQEKYERDQRIAQAFFDKVKADRELREAESKRS